MTKHLVFDINETLLDLSSLDHLFERSFGDAALRRAWFSQLLQSALVATITKNYADFLDIGDAALSMLAEKQHVTLSRQDREAILGGMRRLRPHPEVPESLEYLRRAGYRLAALSNSSQASTEAKLSHAGLSDFFEQILSVERVRVFKPAPQTYEMAADALGITTKDICMVAAHGWDLAGAMTVGCSAAFVARHGEALEPRFPKPEVIGRDLSEVAAALIKNA